jgi:glycosyltransferase involved in cell wall biosynthesis
MNRFGEMYNNVFYHGRFKNPEDLPVIYKNIDLLLCAYDYRIDNVRYAEPNKLYESIYFRKPIIVSSNTFLAKKVSDLGIGYHLDSLDNNAIISFIQNITLESIETKRDACSDISQEECIINDQLLFSRIRNI